jgi:Ca2+-binding RTX toxin-like protein
MQRGLTSIEEANQGRNGFVPRHKTGRRGIEPFDNPENPAVGLHRLVPDGSSGVLRPIVGSGGGHSPNGGFGNDIIDATHSAAGQALASGLGDKIFGNIGNDTINGLGGNDFIDGGADQDFYKGAKGADRFVLTDTAVGATRDVIQDFHHNQHDRINLSAIDAKEGPAGDQAFHFIGHQQFSGKAGELRFVNHILRGDTDGDGIADFEIGINGKVVVQADFIL